MEEITILEVDVSVAATALRASRIIGADVGNEQGEPIGTVDDLMIDDDDYVAYAILSVGGFLGFGAHLVAVAFADLEIRDGAIVLPGASREALKRLPKFDYR